MVIPPELREFAETPSRFIDVPPRISVTKFADDRVCIVQGPTWSIISGVNTTTADLDDLITEVRRRVPPDKEPSWDLGPSTRPASAHEELERRGFRPPRDGHPIAIGLALTVAPDGPKDVDVRRLESFEDYKAARELAWDAHEVPEDRRAKQRARLAEDFEERSREYNLADFLVNSEGRLAGYAGAVASSRGVLLIGGATASWARGRGLYRALVRARWEYAVSLGTPALVVQAVPETSYPILTRLGFVEVCRIRRLEDPGPV